MAKRILTEFRRKYLRFRTSELRREVKIKCIEYKGGKCIRCGYDKCPAALIFHHPISSEKDFGISANGYSRSFEKCKPELDKCILLCTNCHAEVHYEEDQIVREIKRKEIENEKRHWKESIIKQCSFCQKDIKVFNSANAQYNYCNRNCRTKHQNYIFDLDWVSNDELIKLEEEFSIKEIALKLNKTIKQVYARLDKIKNIPR